MALEVAGNFVSSLVRRVSVRCRRRWPPERRRASFEILSRRPSVDRQAVTHGTRATATIAAKVAATTPSTASGTMPIQ
jgi:hypothetical protein